MRYYKVYIAHKDHKDEGKLELKVLGNSYFEVSNAVAKQLNEGGYPSENYLITLEELIDEKDLNKIACH